MNCKETDWPFATAHIGAETRPVGSPAIEIAAHAHSLGSEGFCACLEVAHTSRSYRPHGEHKPPPFHATGLAGCVLVPRGLLVAVC
eukprot:6072622-Prymnesium_polylepis.1